MLDNRYTRFIRQIILFPCATPEKKVCTRHCGLPDGIIYCSCHGDNIVFIGYWNVSVYCYKHKPVNLTSINFYLPAETCNAGYNISIYSHLSSCTALQRQFAVAYLNLMIFLVEMCFSLDIYCITIGRLP